MTNRNVFACFFSAKPINIKYYITGNYINTLNSWNTLANLYAKMQLLNFLAANGYFKFILKHKNMAKHDDNVCISLVSFEEPKDHLLIREQRLKAGHLKAIDLAFDVLFVDFQFETLNSVVFPLFALADFECQALMIQLIRLAV